ncbi:MAG: TIM barrel protein [Kiritimatiellae bacterium]|nr:TIM barrel protein [Kiritimatiellia bacterium]MDD5522558.1 TIM barrel protein [Kiritimatiellia bacterium]
MNIQDNITRRDFLKTAGFVSAAAGAWNSGILCSHGAEYSMPPVAVFSKLYQELKLSFAESAEVTAEAGLDGIDCAVRPKGEILPECAADEMPRYAEELTKRKVRMLFLTTAITGVSSPHAETILRTAKKLGVQYYRIGYWLHNPSTPPEKLIIEIKAQLKDLAALNKEVGICAIFQNHSSKKRETRMVGGDLPEMYDILKDFDPNQLAAAFDLGHAIVTHGDEWRSHFEKLKPHFKIAYIKDMNRPRNFCKFGDGEFGKTDFFKQLKKMNYQAPFSMHIEYDWAEGNPKTRTAMVNVLKNSRRMLQQWMTAE